MYVYSAPIRSSRLICESRPTKPSSFWATPGLRRQMLTTFVRDQWQTIRSGNPLVVRRQLHRRVYRVV